MTAEIREVARPQSRETDLHVRLSCDDGGGWALSEPKRPARHFTDFDTALHTARHSPVTRNATIEVWQGGEYICCLLSKENPDCVAAAPVDRALPQGRIMSTVERHANRAAEILLTAAGPLFWAALAILVLAASLGWRLARL